MAFCHDRGFKPRFGAANRNSNKLKLLALDVYRRVRYQWWRSGRNENPRSDGDPAAGDGGVVAAAGRVGEAGAGAGAGAARARRRAAVDGARASGRGRREPGAGEPVSRRAPPGLDARDGDRGAGPPPESTIACTT